MRPDQRSETANQRADVDGETRVRGLTAEQMDRAAYVRIRVESAPMDCLLDTGSEACLFPARYATIAGAAPTGQKLFAANGTAISVLGVITVEAELGGQRLTIDGYASNQVTEIILGLNFLRANGAVWRFADGTVEIGGRRHKLKTREGHGACRRVVLETDVDLQPKTEAVLPTYIEYAGRIRNYGE